MASKTTRKGEVDGFAVACFLMLAIGIVAYFIGFGHGHEQGVRDGIAGKYVIDTLSDGTTVVVKKKEPANAH